MVSKELTVLFKVAFLVLLEWMGWCVTHHSYLKKGMPNNTALLCNVGGEWCLSIVILPAAVLHFISGFAVFIQLLSFGSFTFALCFATSILFLFLFVCSNQMGFFLFMLCCIFLYISFHILLSFFHILFVFSLHGLSPHLVREATCTMQLKSIGNCYICLLSGWVSIVNKWWRL